MEAGYGDPVGTAQRAWEAGAVGINLEDVTGDEESTHVPIDQQVDVIRRIRTAVPNLVVNARTDVFLMGIGKEESRLARTIERLQAYGEAGAQCVFAPGLKDFRLISQLTAALKTPLNLLAGPGFPNLKEMKDLGVRRVSVGFGAYARLSGPGDENRAGTAKQRNIPDDYGRAISVFGSKPPV